MEWWQAIILGVVQGLTEFLPISSSGHLIIFPWLFDWETSQLTFDASLHLGTLAAVVVYFWRRSSRMVAAIPVAVRNPVGILNGDDERISVMPTPVSGCSSSSQPSRADSRSSAGIEDQRPIPHRGSTPPQRSPRLLRC